MLLIFTISVWTRFLCKVIEVRIHHYSLFWSNQRDWLWKKNDWSYLNRKCCDQARFMWPSVLQLEIYSSCFCLTEAALHTPQASFLHGCAMNSKPLTQLLVAPSGGGGAAMKSFGCMILFHVPLQWYKIPSEVANLTLYTFIFTIFDCVIRKCAVSGIGFVVASNDRGCSKTTWTRWGGSKNASFCPRLRWKIPTSREVRIQKKSKSSPHS